MNVTMNTIWILRGVSGSGKSFLANLMFDLFLFKGLSVEIFSTDNYFYNSFGEYCFDVSKLGEYHKRNQNDVRKAMSEGVEQIIIDNTNTTKKELKPYIDMANEFYYKVRVITNECPISEAINNNDKRAISRKVPEETLKLQYERLKGIL